MARGAHGSVHVNEETLRLSRSPAAEIAAAALQAQEAAGLQAADFVIVAVEPGEGGVAQTAIDVELPSRLEDR